MNEVIKIIGARQHNLKNLELEIPLGQMTAITGVSGSGKSSLALSTLYAEGQRRYIESFSPYVRQFLDREDRPNVDKIDGIPPAIAIERLNRIRSSRSTVGTITELEDYLKLLFYRTAALFCATCGREVIPATAAAIYSWWTAQPQGQWLVMFPFPEGSPAAIREFLISLGLVRTWSPQGIERLDDAAADAKPDYVIVDRLASGSDMERFIDAVEQAFKFGSNRVALLSPAAAIIPFRKGRYCAYCDVKYQELSPNLFSYNSPVGACPTCEGFGAILHFDRDKIAPNPNLSIEKGAIKPWTTALARDTFEELLAFCQRSGIPTNIPFKDLSSEAQTAILQGTSDYYGVKGFFQWLETKCYKMHVRVLLSRYRSQLPCPTCHGSRMTSEALLYRLLGKTISELRALTLGQLADFLQRVWTVKPDHAAALVLTEMQTRVGYLLEVGLGYLSLDRPSRTLSGGEVQRVNLTSALGASLVNTLFVLDEPSAGLHSRDIGRLIKVMRRLTQIGNTVVVVEHDPEVIRSCDHIIDLGPGGGEAGGNVLYQGPLDRFVLEQNTLTAQYVRTDRPISALSPNGAKPWGAVKLRGATRHNLQNLDVSFPLGKLVCLTGVSGSGKSTLMAELLYPAVRKFLGEPLGTIDGLGGVEIIGSPKQVLLVDSAPLAASPRATPATILKILDPIRALFAATEAARDRGFTPGHFSFNAPAGQCPACRGQGYEVVEMQFLSDIMLKCTTCKGKRYRAEVLTVKWHGLSIVEVLDLTASEAIMLFSEHKEITKPLNLLKRLGLEYLRLGQPLATLSVGESQRLKLAVELQRGEQKRTVFLFDEPTTGLHPHDIGKLLTALRDLLSMGNAVIAIEHNLEFIRAADHLIDLGPEGGLDGGRIVVEGPPQALARHETSHTGRALRMSLADRLATPTVNQQPSDEAIMVKGAREHNLRDVELRIPHNKLIAITGVSGSGKSTLAFDILFAEGQRRYIECLSTYARRFIKQLSRPDVDRVTGIPPAVAIEQRLSPGSVNSTVGTMCEVMHYMRLLFAKIGVQHCPTCGEAISGNSPEVVADELVSAYGTKTVSLVAPVVVSRKGSHREVMLTLGNQGCSRVYVDGNFYPAKQPPDLDRYTVHDVGGERAQVAPASLDRQSLITILRRALEFGRGHVWVVAEQGGATLYSTINHCLRCNRSFPELTPLTFSFHSPSGWCPICQGAGEVDAAEDERGTEFSKVKITCPECQGLRLQQIALAVQLPGQASMTDQKQAKPRDGIALGDNPAVDHEDKTMGVRVLVGMTVAEALKFWSGVKFIGRAEVIARELLPEITARLKFMTRVGLGYLELPRSMATLSGGEIQRTRLAAQLSSNLRGALYVLDEPTIGLHRRDHLLLLETLKELRDNGNTVVVVEHDEETIRQADVIVDLGPGGGTRGGEVVAVGALTEILQEPRSITGRCLSQPKLQCQDGNSQPDRFIKLCGAHAHNLRHLTVDVPLERLTVVTGVSGSGKSSLLLDVLYRNLNALIKSPQARLVDVESIDGYEQLNRVLLVDQSPIGRTPRSNPATYIGCYDDIRKVFALTPEAKVRGYGSNYFSFNVKGGRCESCQGQGRNKVEMRFLPDVYVPCEVCEGKRFRQDVLEITLKSRSIADVLAMTVEEALAFFAGYSKITRPLQVLFDSGLGYLKVGQESNTLSGGEAQRVKLAAELGKSSSKQTLYLLDEPTTGLHKADVARLVALLKTLAARGDTVVVVEHDLDFVAQCDHVIDLGPEGGAAGGQLVAAGSPMALLRSGVTSHTIKHLREHVSP